MNDGAGLPQAPSASASASTPAPSAPASPPHDVPSAAELLEAVRAFLTADVLPATEGRVRFHVRVAANVLSMVERELTLGPDQKTAHAARLEHLGVADEAELAAAIRSGALDDRMEEVRAAVRATVADKLAVANPGYAARDVSPEGGVASS